MLEVCSVEIAKHSSYRDKYTVSLCLERRSVVFEVDCGAAVTLVSWNWIQRNFPNLKMYDTNLKLRIVREIFRLMAL